MGRDHGGNIDAARARHGGAPDAWIDLSTGINRRPWIPGEVPRGVWTALPDAGLTNACLDAARAAYLWSGAIVAVAGAQAAIQLLPRVLRGTRAAILSPTYNEHAAAFRAAGWNVVETGDPAALHGADAAVVVDPNNPDGRRLGASALRALADRVGTLVIDASFADTDPDPMPRIPGAVVLRSFGKFYGLAGLRLGFALGPEPVIAALREAAGPWAVGGPALHVGARALADRDWAQATRARLSAEAPRLDALAAGAGWTPLGGTPLFRLYGTPDAAAAQDALAGNRIWSRIFPYSDSWLRLGLPGPADEWDRVEASFAALR